MNLFFQKNIGLFTVIVCTCTSLATAQQRHHRHAAALPLQKHTQPVMVDLANKPTDTAFTLTYTLPEAKVTSSGKSISAEVLSEIQVGNTVQRGDEGKPVLPVIPAYIVIPSGRTLGSVSIGKSTIKNIPGTLRINHGAAHVPLKPGMRARIATPDSRIYQSDAPFPANVVEIVGIFKKQGVSIAVINLHPVVYHPSSGRASCYSSIMLTVTTKAMPNRTAERTRKAKTNLATLTLENPEALDSYEELTPDSSQGTNPTPLGICDPALSYSYVLITADSIKNATTDVTVRDLIAQKQARGTTATIVTTDSIYANYTGIDNPEKIRNFILDAYTNWETDFVLLGGDINIIPLRTLYCNSDAGSDNIPSDLYYQCLDGTFNNDGDSYWGEPNDGPGGSDVDLMAEVLVGRASAQNKTEMANFVYKTITYQNTPENSPFLRRALMSGEELGFGGVSEYATGSMEEIRLGSSSHGYTTVGFAASPLFSVDTLYDSPTFTWSASNLIASMNAGTYGIYNHLGHANETFVMKLYSSDADALTNNNFFFFYSQGCDPGAFDVDCFAEHITTSTRHGAFATILNARYGWGASNSTDGPSQRFDRQFWDAYFGEFMLELGALNAKSHEDNIWDINGANIRWCFYETNLFGDPKTIVRGRLSGPALAYNSHTISDVSEGNGDGVINPSEVIDATLKVVNIGTDSATTVRATVSTSDPFCTILDSTCTFGTVSCCGTQKTALDIVRFSIAPGCPTPHTISFTCSIKDVRDSTWTSSYSVTVYSSSQISGYVRSFASATPIAGATVTFAGTMSGSCITDATGYYMFGGIDGTYKITVRGNNYLPGDTQTVIIPPSRSNVNFQLKDAPRITVAPASFHETLLTGDSLTTSMVIRNSGTASSGNLHFSITTKDPATGTPALIAASLSVDTSDTAPNVADKAKNSALQPAEFKEHRFDASGLKILYATTAIATDQADSLVTYLRRLSNVDTVKVLSCQSAIPNLAYLQAYDVVVVASSSSWSDANLMGNTLADYVDVGGKVCLLAATFCSGGSWTLSGRIMAAPYSPFASTAYSYSGTASASTFGNHPITQGVASITTTLFSHLTTLQGTATSLGNFTNGYQCVAVNSGMPIVAINVYPKDGYWGGDLVRMMGNVFDFLGGSSWLSVSPESDSLAPGDSTMVTLKFNARDKLGGLYERRLLIAHDATNTSTPLSVPCTLTVDGMRRLSVSPTILSFGNVRQGDRDTLSILLKNGGNEPTVVSSIASNHQGFVAIGTFPLTIPSFDSLLTKIVFSPVSLGLQTGQLTVQSNAEDNPEIMISATGTVIIGPSISVSPLSFRKFTSDNSPIVDSVAIANNGDADLAFTIAINGSSRPIVAKATADSIVLSRHAAHQFPVNNAAPILELLSTDTLARGGYFYSESGEQIPPGANSASPTIPGVSDWQQLRPMTTARGQCGTAVYSGKIYVYGGYAGGSELSSLEIYDIANNTWSSGAALPTADRGMASVVDDSGYIYSFAAIQNSSYRYNPRNNTWQSITSPSTAPWEAAAAKGISGKIYLFGGEGGLNTVSIYDPVLATWSTGAPIPTARLQHCAITGPGGLIFVIGGRSSSSGNALNIVEVYNPATNTWSAAAPMPTARNSFASTLGADNKIYVIGGKNNYMNNEGPFFGVTEIYDPATNTWATGDSLATPRAEMKAVCSGGSIYVIGGTSGTFTNEIQHISASSWLSASTLSGIVTPGARSMVPLTFNPTGLFGGNYVANLQITNNAVPVHVVPCTLTVDGMRRLSVSPSSIAFKTTWIGLRDTAVLTLSNTGSEATQITSIASGNAVFTHSATLPVTIQPGSSTQLRAFFLPTTAGTHSGNLTITSNAEDNPSIVIEMSGTSRIGPTASVNPDSIYYSLRSSNPPETQTCYVHNSGDDTLSYNIQSIDNVSTPLSNDVSDVKQLPAVQQEQIYSRENYNHAFFSGRVIIGLTLNTLAPAQALLDKAGAVAMRELGIARNPKTGLTVSRSRKLFLLTLSDTGADGVTLAIERLRNDPSIAFAEPDYRLNAIATPNDPSFSQLYGMHNIGQTGGTADADIDATEVWDRHTGNRTILIGIIDTGIDYLHPDLAANCWTNPGEIAGNGIDDDHNGFIDDIHGWDFANDDSDPMDDHYHGTHCAGTIAGVGNNGIGVAGVMWTANLVALKFLTSSGSGSTSDAIDAVNYATAMGISITSNSWGGGGFSQALMDAIALSDLFVAAAGNASSDNDVTPNYPSNYLLDNILAVAATDHSDLLASFSCWGRTTVDLGAPGVNIYSCSPGSSYRQLSGTSMATPHVSGAAGIVWSYNPSLTAQQVRELLMNNTDTIASLANKTVTGGRLNVNKALSASGPAWLTASPMAHAKVAPGDSAALSVTVTPEGLAAGEWRGRVVVASNDPVHPQLPIKVTVNIIGCRSLTTSADSISFGNLWAGLRDTSEIVVRNTCNAPVTIAQIASADTDFVCLTTAPVTVPRNGTLTVKIVFSPNEPRVHQSAITILSNAEDNPALTIKLTGTATSPPGITVNPTSISMSLNPAESRTLPLFVGNNGGDNLLFSIGGIQSGASIVINEFSNDPDFIELWNRGSDRNMTGFRLSWVDNTSTSGSFTFPSGYVLRAGKRVVVRESTGTINDSTFYWGTNIGWIEGSIVAISLFDERGRGIDFVRTTGSSDAPPSGISWFGSGAVFSLYDAARSRTADTDSSTDWASSSAHTEYLLNPGQIQGPVTPPWLSVSPLSGSAAPGNNDTVSVTCSSIGLVAGTYSTSFSVTHNAPGTTNPVSVPVVVTVSEMKLLAAHPGSVQFDPILTGQTATAILRLVNTGNAPVRVGSIAFSSSVFSSTAIPPFTVQPFDSLALTIRFSSPVTGSFSGTMTITSDAQNNPSLELPLSGNCLLGPVITVSPTNFPVQLTPGDTALRLLTITNSGGTSLLWTIGHNGGGLRSRESFDTIPGIQDRSFTCSHDLSSTSWSDAGNDAFDGFGYPSVKIGTDSVPVSMLEGQSLYTIGGYKCRVRTTFAENHIYRMIVEPQAGETNPRSDITINLNGNMGSDGSETVRIDSVLIGTTWLKFYTNTDNSYPNGDPRVVFMIVPSQPKYRDSVSYWQPSSGYAAMRVRNITLPATVYIIPSYHTIPAIKAWLQNDITSGTGGWLSMPTDSGSTVGGVSTTIPLFINATNCLPGLYTDTLRISHNDANTGSPLSIPVTMQVLDGTPGNYRCRILSIGPSANARVSGVTYSVTNLTIGACVTGTSAGLQFRARVW